MCVFTGKEGFSYRFLAGAYTVFTSTLGFMGLSGEVVLGPCGGPRGEECRDHVEHVLGSGFEV